jgi:hypothetical protein
MSSKSRATVVKLCVVSEHEVADAPLIVHVRTVLEAFLRHVYTTEFPTPGAALICTVKFCTVTAAGESISTFVSVVLARPPPPMGRYCVPVRDSAGPEYVTMPAPVPAAAIAACTKAVVASCVVLVPPEAVGAAGTPVNVGLAKGANELIRVPLSLT